MFLWSPQERHNALMSLLATARGGVDMRQSIMQVWRMAEELGSLGEGSDYHWIDNDFQGGEIDHDFCSASIDYV